MSATLEIDPRVMEGITRWAEREAAEGRLFTIESLDPAEFGNGVIVAERVTYRGQP